MFDFILISITHFDSLNIDTLYTVQKQIYKMLKWCIPKQLTFAHAHLLFDR